MTAIRVPDGLARRLQEAAESEGLAVDEWLANKLSDWLRQGAVDRFRNIEGLRVPDVWPPTAFEHAAPLQLDGEPLSEQILRERR